MTRLIAAALLATTFFVISDARADFVIDSVRRSIKVNLPPEKGAKEDFATWQRRRQTGAPAPTATPKEYQLSLFFYDQLGNVEPIVIGRLNTAELLGQLIFSVPNDQYAHLEKDYRGRVAQLVWSNLTDQKQVVLNERVYIGGSSVDKECRYPALISDFHKTLDVQSDTCTQPALDRLNEKYMLTTFIVSTGGDVIKHEMRDLKFGNRNQVIVLDKVDRVAAGPSEKALRVSLNLSAAGICVVGFVGDTPEKDGDAARILGVPYYPVHLSGKQGSGPSWCELEKTLEARLQELAKTP